MQHPDPVMNATLVKMQEYFQKPTVTRQEVLDYEAEGNYVPTKFWTLSRVGRGLFQIDGQTPVNTHAVKAVGAVQTPMDPNPVLASDVVSHFDYQSLIPLDNPNYVEWGNYRDVRRMLGAKSFFTLYVTGDSGSGKNEMISQACAKLEKPLVRVSITRETKEEHLIGSKTLVDGSIKYEEGPVVWAAENGAVLLLDEISAGDANELMCLQTVLEGGKFFVKSLNKVITPAPGFCVIATDNTKGRGSDSGRWMGVNILNDAFLERFQMTMEQDYPDLKTEIEIYTRLQNSLGKNDDEFVAKLTKWIHAIRKAYKEEAVEDHIATRRGCHIIRAATMFPPRRSIELCVNRFDDTTKEAFLVLWDKLSNGEEI